MRPLINSEDPDEMPHHAVFHQSLHYWLRNKLGWGELASASFGQDPHGKLICITIEKINIL